MAIIVGKYHITLKGKYAKNMRSFKYLAIIALVIITVGTGLYLCDNASHTEQVLEAVMV